MRLKKIDILKTIGLLCIILAHISPPSLIFQLRNFDVILMIILSACLYFENKNKIINLYKYVYKRFKRLVIPTYIFLIIFFIGLLIIDSSKISIKEIISSFILHNGIGYVWIIRIYLITAILLPIVEKIIIKLKFSKVIILNLFIYILHEILCYYGVFDLNIIFEDILAYTIPCISLIVITYWLKNNCSDNKKVAIFSLINLTFFVLLAYLIYSETGEFQNTNCAKYPFRIYYLSYSLSITGLLFIVMNNSKIVELLYNKFIIFVSKSSLWIYLWHILFIYIINVFSKQINWILKYIIVISCSCLVVYVQNKIIDKLENMKVNKELLKIFRG